ncbi:MAG: RNA-binding protein [Archaeoglobi archaeon]|jgi:predicted RNA-binding protein|nr:CooT family nickel-binding protein [Archaeoglobus sp.]NHW88865.1 CooT family nickel-binding protein [Archaeoglobales archaeon]TDA27360.1 MAG: RNA-binding protein [Archaeoglobi archaeon]
MCESKVLSGNKVIFEDIVRLEVEKDLLVFYDILGKKYELKGKILEIDLIAHKIKVEVLQ